MTETPNPDLDDTQSYDVMLEQLDRTIDEISEKIESGRIRDAEKEKVRIQYYRALGYLIRTKCKVLEDKSLDELADEIEELKADREGDRRPIR